MAFFEHLLFEEQEERNALAGGGNDDDLGFLKEQKKIQILFSMEFLPPFMEWLFSTIRAIFDAKYYEHIINEDFQNDTSRFPDFVFSWMSTFCVDDEERMVRPLEYHERERADNAML
jgi:hypothetical protein